MLIPTKEILITIALVKIPDGTAAVACRGHKVIVVTKLGNIGPVINAFKSSKNLQYWASYNSSSSSGSPATVLLMTSRGVSCQTEVHRESDPCKAVESAVNQRIKLKDCGNELKDAVLNSPLLDVILYKTSCAKKQVTVNGTSYKLQAVSDLVEYRETVRDFCAEAEVTAYKQANGFGTKSSNKLACGKKTYLNCSARRKFQACKANGYVFYHDDSGCDIPTVPTIRVSGGRYVTIQRHDSYLAGYNLTYTCAQNDQSTGQMTCQDKQWTDAVCAKKAGFVATSFCAAAVVMSVGVVGALIWRNSQKRRLPTQNGPVGNDTMTDN